MKTFISTVIAIYKLSMTRSSFPLCDSTSFFPLRFSRAIHFVDSFRYSWMLSRSESRPCHPITRKRVEFPLKMSRACAILVGEVQYDLVLASNTAGRWLSRGKIAYPHVCRYECRYMSVTRDCNSVQRCLFVVMRMEHGVRCNDIDIRYYSSTRCCFSRLTTQLYNT